MFGDGKTSVRGGFGIAYEGTLYNPLSNSRWNLPYYSFDEILGGGVGQPGADVVYGPSVCNGTSGNCTRFPTYRWRILGPPTNPNQGPAGQPQAQGNINGWDPTNPNFANLTGIVFPTGVRDPYVYNFHFGIQREILPKTVIDVKYVGTAGHKLFRAEDVNREPGTRLPAGSRRLPTTSATTWTGMRGPINPNGRLNANYLKLRAWENAVNSNYNSLQASVKRQMSHGLLFNVDYTYSHSIDNGSTWHSGATTANGAGGRRGLHDQRTRIRVWIAATRSMTYGTGWWSTTFTSCLDQNLKGASGMLLGGWSYNGIWAFQSGAHWEPTITSIVPPRRQLLAGWRQCRSL